MIIVDSPQDRKTPLSPDVDTPVASGSSAPPPFIDQEPTERDHLLVEFSHPDEPPPDFAPYVAENFEVGYKDVVSHDPHLNSDGEALYRFLLAQSESIPLLRMNCKGTHNEQRERWVTSHDSQGRRHDKRESYTETVTDFDFCIDIYPEHLTKKDSSNPNNFGPVNWSVPDDVPAYRGRMTPEYEVPPPSFSSAQDESAMEAVKLERKKAARKEVNAYTQWVDRRTRLGLPPWVRQEEETPGVDGSMYDHRDGLKSSKTLRDWADEYCASPKYLKEFVYKKMLYGWNIHQLETSVRATIEGTPYSGCLSISFTPHNTRVYIRPDNWVSRMLSNKWLKFLSIILFVFPFIWLFKRFHSRGGGRWEVCGGAYPLKQWVDADEDDRARLEAQAWEATQIQRAIGEELPAYRNNSWSPLSSPTGLGTINSFNSVASRRSLRYMETPTGPKKLVGLKEGEWFRGWEGVIARAVVGRYQSSAPLPSRGTSSLPARSLDGYDEAGPQLIQF